jgi:hypothetical protein
MENPPKIREKWLALLVGGVARSGKPFDPPQGR